jgi:two-component system, chemotaxis family, chemotaxis protein CheY
MPQQDAIDYAMPVLVAEDDPAALQILAAALEQIGFSNISTAADGEQAYQALQEKEFGLAVLDWAMPGRDGLELVRWIRADARVGSMPVLMVTARTSREEVLKAVRAGVTGFLPKPFKLSEFREKLFEVLAKGRAIPSP